MLSEPSARRKPNALEPGDTIGIVAPASPFSVPDLARGVALLHAMGFATRLSGDLFARQGCLAGSDALRAAQLHTMFADDAVHAIMCARGGYGGLRLLQSLDYALIAAHPKPFIGFSDTTALHQAIRLKTGLVTFHGPMVCSLEPSDAAAGSALQQMLQAVAMGPPRIAGLRTLRPGRGEGILVGGNLSTLCSLIGTPFAQSYHGCVLFLEDRGERPYRIDRMLVQMKLAGCFEGLAGLVLGSFSDCGAGEEIDAIVRQLFDDRPIPIMTGLAAGHQNPNRTLPLGVTVVLDAGSGTLRFEEAATVQKPDRISSHV
ncbi:S66 peptidase family protein [Desulfatitalea alkaliphila]|uniref:LD-carboxypeptidase n=1 Tax=Desulfatitalea alkaliphila TaxID=2929485 RepID=A0AA41UM90_9BACT|nr:LD-carboxypeptidase [Desulfatitalea alkaliphila]MCJ8502381.1 LD-carboxypeptidase [Desulfatitalea alkaliphila]